MGMCLASPNPIPLSFYQSEDVIALGKDLLGKVIYTHLDGTTTSGVIVETESYKGPEDKASHAYAGRRTQRNEVMYAMGGCAYIYKCYGIHNLLNIVTNQKEIPHAILIRAIEPLEGIPAMLNRRRKDKVDRRLTGGPGVVSQALGLSLKHNGLALNSREIWLEDHHIRYSEAQIVASPRVGIDYAEEYRHTPWRFRVRNNGYTSPAK